MRTRPTDAHRLEYEQRVNRVIDHVRDHLADELSLAGLARVAAFSPFHFHRVFTAVTGETLFGFIQRLRIERAAVALSLHAERSVLAVALDHGFTSAAGFARAFRARFGMSASAWRDGGARRWRRRHHPDRKPGKVIRKAGKARRASPRDPRRMTTAMGVRIVQAPPYHVAYMRHVGPYGTHGIPALWARLGRWMQGRAIGPEGRITLGIAYDDPAVTAAEHCRYDACVVVPPDFAPDRAVNLMDVAGGTYAVGTFVGAAHEITGVWDRVFATWLPGSGWQPDDRPCFELYRGDPTVDEKAGSFRCDLLLPVRPL
ncbi:MAG: AraC family transcriptional regulator [Candidatus Rokubacteria bacterium]|nr:AraC family transcriptional regulator [Candidatus Rokubacteria bacterium]